jgi:tetratricopeptide (TPR) repeat protein
MEMDMVDNVSSEKRVNLSEMMAEVRKFATSELAQSLVSALLPTIQSRLSTPEFESVKNAINQALSEVRATGLDGTFISNLVVALQADLTNGDYKACMNTINLKIREAKKWGTILQDLFEEIELIQQEQAARDRFSDHWWEQQRQALQAKSDLADGWNNWLWLYTDALTANALAICGKLVIEPFPFLDTAPVSRSLFEAGTSALLEERYTDALDLLSGLAQYGGAKDGLPLLAAETRSMLEIFIGRILDATRPLTENLSTVKPATLDQPEPVDAVLQHFEQACQMVRNNGLPLAARAGYYYNQQNFEQASADAKRAIELSPDVPEGYIELGRWSEHECRWDEATNLYDQALAQVDKVNDPYRTLRRLCMSLPANLCTRLAQRLFDRGQLEAALPVVDAALKGKISGPATDPEIAVYDLKRNILEGLKRSGPELAGVYYEIGKRYYSSDKYADAIRLLYQAKELDPSLPLYWILADSLVRSSYIATAPFVDEQAARASQIVWEEGFVIKPLDTTLSWPYLTRAFVSDQLSRLPGMNQHSQWWEAAVYAERALVLYEDAYRWAYIGRYLGNAGLEANALYSTAQALEFDENIAVALEERATILANTGLFENALNVLEKRMQLDPANYWARSVKAYVLVEQLKVDAALELLGTLLEQSPQDKWSRSLRAICLEELNRKEEAHQEYELIWKQYDPNYPNNEVGWSAYTLGFTDDAIRIYENLKGDTSQRGNVYRSLGIIHLSRRELDKGKEYLLQGLDYALNTRELDDLLRWDFHEIEVKLQGEDAATAAVMAELKQRIIVRRQELDWPRDNPERVVQEAEREIKRVLDQPSPDDQNRWVQVAAHAALARLYKHAGRWQEAIDEYRFLEEEGKQLKNAQPWEPFREAGQGIETVNEARNRTDRPSAFRRVYNAIASYSNRLASIIKEQVSSQ